jgi:hypothetical protein
MLDAHGSSPFLLPGTSAASFLNEVTSAIAILCAPCRGGRMCSWLEAKSISHKESVTNIHSRGTPKYAASATVAEPFRVHRRLIGSPATRHF